LQQSPEKGITAAQLALAWLLHQGKDIVPIPGSRRFANMHQNAAAVDVSLNLEELARLDAVLPVGAAAGERADSAYISNINY